MLLFLGYLEKGLKSSVNTSAFVCVRERERENYPSFGCIMRTEALPRAAEGFSQVKALSAQKLVTSLQSSEPM